MTPRSQFQIDCYEALETCLRAWPAIHSECDAAAYPAVAASNGSTNSNPDADPDKYRSGLLARSAAATTWITQWHTWISHVVGPSTMSWTVPYTRQALQLPFQAIVISTDLAGGWQARRTHRGLRACLQLLHLSNHASAYKPRISRGTTIGGQTIGDRTNTTEQCAGCGDVILCTADDPVKRMDGQPFHYRSNPTSNQPACYWQAWRRRQQAAASRPSAR